MWSADIVTVQVPVPVQSPLQPVNTEPASGVAVNATEVPSAKSAAQVAPQVIPAGALVTVPVPVPALVTVRWWDAPVVATRADRVGDRRSWRSGGVSTG